MVSFPVKNQMESTWSLPVEKESSVDRLQRQLHELEKRVDKYFDDLSNVEEMREQAKANIDRRVPAESQSGKGVSEGRCRNTR